jgi:hypothetical protein
VQGASGNAARRILQRPCPISPPRRAQEEGSCQWLPRALRAKRGNSGWDAHFNCCRVQVAVSALAVVLYGSTYVAWINMPPTCT